MIRHYRQSPLFSPKQGTMANKGPAYGLSRQVQDKIEQKYDTELEARLVEWIVAQCGPAVGKPEAGKLGFQTWLKDGCVSNACLLLSGHFGNHASKNLYTFKKGLPSMGVVITYYDRKSLRWTKASSYHCS